MKSEKPSKDLETRVKIILAAEQLFGQRGINAVSFRQIRIEAGQSNNSAIDYYFKSRADLVQAILVYRVNQMEGIRRQMIKEGDVSQKGNDLENLLKALLLPQLEIKDKEGRRPYVRFISEYLIRFRAMGIKHPGDSDKQAPVLAELMERLYKELFWLNRDVALMRLTSATLIFLNLVNQWERGLTFSEHQLELNVISDEALTMGLAALEARPSRALKELYQK